MPTFSKENKAKSNFEKICISLASPEDIKERSSGEVTKPETVNYRTYKPEKDGLFCEKIFGPTKDYECNCGKYKRIRYRGIVCDKCGVEVTEKKVRRERMGHIELQVPVAHVWFFRSNPNKIAMMLGLQAKLLEKVIYYEKYLITDMGILEGMSDSEIKKLIKVGSSNDQAKQNENEEIKYFGGISEGTYCSIQEYLNRDENKEAALAKPFKAGIGAEVIYELLAAIDVDKLTDELKTVSKWSALNLSDKDKSDFKENSDYYRYRLEKKDPSKAEQNEALKRLQVVKWFQESKAVNRPEYMILKVIPVIPPDIRPLIPLDGGRFAASDLNELYRRVIIRNNRLKRLMDIKAPEIILRNEKRMLQEAVDALFDNSKKNTAVKSDQNRALKSLSDSLKGKQGRFRQNLLGKRVDFSARSVIVVGPELKMHECGLPKLMAAELYKPFIIRKLIERGIVKTVKSAKKMVDRKEPVIWEILEYVMKGHPVLLNRAPTLHRLGIQAFQPKMIEGKAIQLHPLACTAFNADFDGDQMAVHLPLGNAAVLEAQLLMLGSHNILNPASGEPVTVPTQDMVLGLYYITKIMEGAKGEGMNFYGPQEVIIALNEKKIDIHANINVRLPKDKTDLSKGYEMVSTSAGRIMVNQFVPTKVPYINEVFSKKSLKTIIGVVIKNAGISRTARFLDDIKSLGYTMAFKSGISFNLGDVIIPEEKEKLMKQAYGDIQQITDSYSLGYITDNERYNHIIDIWTKLDNKLTDVVMNKISSDQKGFNPVYMMLDSGARGSQTQIKQLCGMRGLMAKAQKAGSQDADMIENPIISNFKEGMSVLEYFISTHGARKGLTDTALKTADAGYLTRRLVDVSHNVIINEEDCGTIRGIVATEIKNKDGVAEKLYDRILGRVSVHDIFNPVSGELIISAGEQITESVAKEIEDANIKQVEIRSVLTCESRKGVCAKCYGRNLATSRMVEIGEVVGVIAAQSIGEPGTQLTLRSFHNGGASSSQATDNSITSNFDGQLHYSDLRTIKRKSLKPEGGMETVVVSRTTELHIVDENTGFSYAQFDVPYGSILYKKDNEKVAQGDKICEWDPYNAINILEISGIVRYKNIIKDVNYVEKTTMENQAKSDKEIVESRDKNLVPVLQILDPKDKDHVLKEYNLSVGIVITHNDGDKANAGDIITRIPRAIRKSTDITGGLPRVTELFEARSSTSVPIAILSEINGYVKIGRITRNSREIEIHKTSDLSDKNPRKSLVPLSRQILVQDNDYVKAGGRLSDGALSPTDILNILGPIKVQEYIVNEVQEVYRLQGLKINDKHFEIIVRQMMNKVQIQDAGDTEFLANEEVNKIQFNDANISLYGKRYVIEHGDSETYRNGDIISVREEQSENESLERQGKKTMACRDTRFATAIQLLKGITPAALKTDSFMSAASFQETTKVLSEAAIRGRVDYLEGLKENVICGHAIPAGTGQKQFREIKVSNMEEYKSMLKDL